MFIQHRRPRARREPKEGGWRTGVQLAKLARRDQVRPVHAC